MQHKMVDRSWGEYSGAGISSAFYMFQKIDRPIMLPMVIPRRPLENPQPVSQTQPFRISSVLPSNPQLRGYKWVSSTRPMERYES